MPTWEWVELADWGVWGGKWGEGGQRDQKLSQDEGKGAYGFTPHD